MKYIAPTVSLITEPAPLKKIELVGRTCYKSENKITEDSAPKFVKSLIKSQHTAMLEHQTFVFEVTSRNEHLLTAYLDVLDTCPYIHITKFGWPVYRVLVSGSVRALNECAHTRPILTTLQAAYPELVYASWFDNDQSNFTLWDGITATLVDLDSLANLQLSDIAAHKCLTFRVVTDRGVTHEMVRHRPASYAQESTRYVSYKDGINVALPVGFDDKAEQVQKEYEAAFYDAEKHYRTLLDMGEAPQQARAVLPTGLKTEIVMTANCAEWQHFFNLRLFGTTGKPHPDMQYVAKLMFNTAMEQDPVFANWAKRTFAELYDENTKNILM